MGKPNTRRIGVTKLERGMTVVTPGKRQLVVRDVHVITKITTPEIYAVRVWWENPPSGNPDQETIFMARSLVSILD